MSDVDVPSRSLRLRSESAENQALGRRTRLGGGARRIKPNENAASDDDAASPAPAPAVDKQAWQEVTTSAAAEEGTRRAVSARASTSAAHEEAHSSGKMSSRGRSLSARERNNPMQRPSGGGGSGAKVPSYLQPTRSSATRKEIVPAGTRRAPPPSAADALVPPGAVDAPMEQTETPANDATAPAAAATRGTSAASISSDGGVDDTLAASRHGAPDAAPNSPTPSDCPPARLAGTPSPFASPVLMPPTPMVAAAAGATGAATESSQLLSINSATNAAPDNGCDGTTAARISSATGADAHIGAPLPEAQAASGAAGGGAGEALLIDLSDDAAAACTLPAVAPAHVVAAGVLLAPSADSSAPIAATEAADAAVTADAAETANAAEEAAAAEMVAAPAADPMETMVAHEAEVAVEELMEVAAEPPSEASAALSPASAPPSAHAAIDSKPSAVVAPPVAPAADMAAMAKGALEAPSARSRPVCRPPTVPAVGIAGSSADPFSPVVVAVEARRGGPLTSSRRTSSRTGDSGREEHELAVVSHFNYPAPPSPLIRFTPKAPNAARSPKRSPASRAQGSERQSGGATAAAASEAVAPLSPEPSSVRASRGIYSREADRRGERSSNKRARRCKSTPSAAISQSPLVPLGSRTMPEHLLGAMLLDADAAEVLSWDFGPSPDRVAHPPTSTEKAAQLRPPSSRRSPRAKPPVPPMVEAASEVAHSPSADAKPADGMLAALAVPAPTGAAAASAATPRDGAPPQSLAERPLPSSRSTGRAAPASSRPLPSSARTAAAAGGGVDGPPSARSAGLTASASGGSMARGGIDKGVAVGGTASAASTARGEKGALRTALVEVCEPLKAVEEDWEKRTAALRAIPPLLTQAAQMGQLDALLDVLHKPLSTQAADLRSSVVRVATSVITTISTEHGRAIGPLAVAVLPSLLKGLYVSVKAISQAADGAATKVVQSCPTSAVLSVLLAFTTDTHHQTRRGCADLIAAILRAGLAPPAAQLSAVLNAIKALTSDADPKAREAAGKCFWTVHAQWPDQAEAVKEKLDASQQKLIKRTRPT